MTRLAIINRVKMFSHVLHDCRLIIAPSRQQYHFPDTAARIENSIEAAGALTAPAEPSLSNHAEPSFSDKPTGTSQPCGNSTGMLLSNAQRGSLLTRHNLPPGSSSSTTHTQTIRRNPVQADNEVEVNLDSRQRNHACQTSTHLGSAASAPDDQQNIEKKDRGEELRIWEEAKPVADRYLEAAIRDDERMRRILQKRLDGKLDPDDTNPEWNLYYIRWIYDRDGRDQASFFAHIIILERYRILRERRRQTAMRSKIEG